MGRGKSRAPATIVDEDRRGVAAGAVFRGGLGRFDGGIRGGLAMRLLYSWLVRCAAPFAFLVVLWRGLRDRCYWQGLGERWGMGSRLTAPSLWLHAVSLGEMTAAAPLLRALRERHPHMPLVVTTAT